MLKASTLKQRLSNFSESPGGLVKTEIARPTLWGVSVSKLRLENLYFNHFPGAAAAAGPGSHFEY